MSGISRIGGPAGIGRPAPRRADGKGFQVPEEAPQASPASAAGPIGLAALLALQDEEEPPRDRAARRQARALLAELDALHAALLGAGGFTGLARLAALLDAMPDQAADPALRDAVADIALRARIELARYATEG